VWRSSKAAEMTHAATIAIMIVDSALISGETPVRTEE
jgi:hypothetical protein